MHKVCFEPQHNTTCDTQEQSPCFDTCIDISAFKEEDDLVEYLYSQKGFYL